MVREVLRRLVYLFARGDDGEAGEERGDAQDDDESEFLPSRLDASVLEAHGMETTPAERELAQLQEKADQLEEQERNP